jgi:hypothetical protein
VAASLTAVSVESNPSSIAELGDLIQIPVIQPVLAEPTTVTSAAVVPAKPANAKTRSGLSLDHKRAWIAVTVMQHSMAAFDAWSTRQSLTSGHAKELNPLMKPFAGSGAIYAAIQVAPLGTDWLAHRLQESHNSVFHRLWWLPQVASAVGFGLSGIKNLRVASGH